MGASPWIVSDDLRDRFEPLQPKRERRFRYPGRGLVPDRQVLCGILFVPHTGIQWEYLPQELDVGCGMTHWRRLRDWNAASVWQQLYEALLAELNAAARLDWSRSGRRLQPCQGANRGLQTGPFPVAPGRVGSKHHLITDGHGTPLAVILAGGNRNHLVPGGCGTDGTPSGSGPHLAAGRRTFTQCPPPE